LVSGYLTLIGDEFGFDSVAPARGDRFLPQVMNEIEKVGSADPHTVMRELVHDMSVQDWLQVLLADINNQAPHADRLIDRECIWAWAVENMGGEARHRIFYDEERASEFQDLDPKEPTKANRFQPFLSCRVLVEVLEREGMLERAEVLCFSCGQQTHVDRFKVQSDSFVICEGCIDVQQEQLLRFSHEPPEIARQLLKAARCDHLPQTPDSFREVCNFDLALGFVGQMQDFGCGGTQTEPEIVYHWTRQDNIPRILDNSLLKAGETNKDGSCVAQAHGKVHGEGIYAFDNISDGESYGAGAPCALLCLGLPGRKREGACLKTGDGYDSLAHGKMRVYSRSSQLLPLYLTSRSGDAEARRAAERVKGVLREHAQAAPRAG